MDRLEFSGKVLIFIYTRMNRNRSFVVQSDVSSTINSSRQRASVTQ